MGRLIGSTSLLSHIRGYAEAVAAGQVSGPAQCDELVVPRPRPATPRAVHGGSADGQEVPAGA